MSEPTMQKLGARLRKAWEAHHQCACFCDGCDSCAQICVLLPSLLDRLDAQPEDGDGPRWISVETRLPGKSDEYLVVEPDMVVTVADFRIPLEHVRQSQWFTVRSFGVDCEERELHQVTHWAALLAPPSADAEEK